MLDFPFPFVPDVNTRAGRMMTAGRVKITVSWGQEHITVLYKAFADNRKREYKEDSTQNWVACPLVDATHVFVEVPSQGQWNDKIGTFYPRGGRWYDADNADEQRVLAAKMVAQWLMDHTAAETTYSEFVFKASEECYVCGLELTHPDSIARGIGSECAKKGYASIHQVKSRSTIAPKDVDDSYTDLGITDTAMGAFAETVKGMSEDQLEQMREVIDTRMAEVVEMRHALVDSAREAPAGNGFTSAAQSALGRGQSTDAPKVVDRGFMAR